MSKNFKFLERLSPAFKWTSNTLKNRFGEQNAVSRFLDRFTLNETFAHAHDNKAPDDSTREQLQIPEAMAKLIEKGQKAPYGEFLEEGATFAFIKALGQHGSEISPLQQKTIHEPKDTSAENAPPTAGTKTKKQRHFEPRLQLLVQDLLRSGLEEKDWRIRPPVNLSRTSEKNIYIPVDFPEQNKTVLVCNCSSNAIYVVPRILTDADYEKKLTRSDLAKIDGTERIIMKYGPGWSDRIIRAVTEQTIEELLDEAARLHIQEKGEVPTTKTDLIIFGKLADGKRTWKSANRALVEGYWGFQKPPEGKKNPGLREHFENRGILPKVTIENVLISAGTERERMRAELPEGQNFDHRNTGWITADSRIVQTGPLTGMNGLSVNKRLMRLDLPTTLKNVLDTYRRGPEGPLNPVSLGPALKQYETVGPPAHHLEL